MKNKNTILILTSLFIFQTVFGQETDPGGIWTSVSTEKKLGKKFSIGTEFEFRSKGFNFDRERLGMQIAGDYEIIKGLKFGASYTFLNVEDDYRFTNDSIRVHFQNRHRTHLQLSWRYKLGNFTFSLRERAQWTFKDETDRIRIYPGYPPVIGINSNRINPDLVWRNRAKLTYNIKKFPVTPSFSFESYYLLNEPEDLRIFNADGSDFRTTNTFFSKLRYSLAFEYKIDKKNSIEVYGMLNSQRGAEEKAVPGPNYYILSDWKSNYVLGLGYNITL
jgi:hypothetical protein